MADFLTSTAAVQPQVYSDLAGLNALKLQSRENPEGALHEVAQQFESVFITMMMKAMRDTLPKDGMFASGQMDTYQEMFDQQLALDLSRQNGIGLAAEIERQLSAAQRYQPADAGQAGGLADSQPAGDESHG
jgi:peptidoglycan hydrolase FlgJ